MANNFYLCVLPLVCSLPTGVVLFQLFLFNDELDDYDYYLNNTFILCMYILWIVAYYQSIRISNTHSPYTIMPKRKVDMSPYNSNLYMNNKTCQRDGGKFKPIRTSHCHLCGCQLKMDHHCPWTNNCVGVRNHRAFVVFCLFSAMMGWHYQIRNFSFYFVMKEYEEDYDYLPIVFYIVWVIFTLLILLLSISLTGLTFSHLLMASKNMTTLQVMKGTFKFGQDPKKPNIFDFGRYTNLAMFFDYDTFFFWLPKQTVTINDGTDFPTRPPVTLEQVQKLSEDIKQSLKTDDEKSLPKTLQQLREMHADDYKNALFFFLDEQYKLNEDEATEQPTQALNRTEEDKQLLEDVYS